MEHYNLFELGGVIGAITAARDNHLLTGLVEAEHTPGEWASRLGLDHRATHLVLDILETAGIAAEHDGRYTASDELRGIEQGPGGLMMIGRLWEGTSEFLRSGRRVVRMDGEAANREQAYKDVVSRLGEMFAPAAAALAPRLEGIPRTILDIGAGSGVWSLAMAARNPVTMVTALDFPDVLPAFLERGGRRGLADRIRTIPGDIFAVDLPEGVYDRIVLANILHLETPERASEMIRRAARGLAPKGEMVVIDIIEDGDRNLARARAVYRLHLTLRTEDGQAYSAEDLANWMKDAGLASPQMVTLGAAGNGISALVAGRAGLNTSLPIGAYQASEL